ncbi:MAG: hypothetical protein IPK18_12085 [Sphingobacteriales bacterium]|nr:MAG: hypothetical protein IPK18_12085 [Sphingobacteriales bacterium]
MSIGILSISFTLFSGIIYPATSERNVVERFLRIATASLIGTWLAKF